MWLRKCEIRKLATKEFPYNLPLFSDDLIFEFNKAITVIAGENGTGKSTFLENLASAIGFNVYGGGADQSKSKVYIPTSDIFETSYVEKQEQNPDSLHLANNIKLTWNMKTKQGFFLRGEHYLDIVAQLSSRDKYFKSSHGEGMLELINDRFKDGIFILDEPETALSPIRQLKLLTLLIEKVKIHKAQYIIATHSPILMAIPDSDFFYIQSGKFLKEDYKNNVHFEIMHRFMENPEKCIDWFLDINKK